MKYAHSYTCYILAKHIHICTNICSICSINICISLQIRKNPSTTSRLPSCRVVAKYETVFWPRPTQFQVSTTTSYLWYFSKRLNEHSILGLDPGTAPIVLNHFDHFVNPQKRVFNRRRLSFASLSQLDESYVRVFAHTNMHMNQAY